jgi:hypothetical protein
MCKHLREASRRKFAYSGEDKFLIKPKIKECALSYKNGDR